MQKNTGFTLIELLIVVAIAGLLAVVGGLKFGDTIRVTKIRRAKAEIQALAVALRSFHMDCGGYPLSYPTTGQISTFEQWQGILVENTKLAQGREEKYWAGPYITRAKLDPWGNPYIFHDYTDPEDTRITAILCPGKDGDEDIEWTEAYKEEHPGNPRDNIAICHKDDVLTDWEHFDIVYWME